MPVSRVSQQFQTLNPSECELLPEIDIVERYQLSLMLSVIAMRNLIEMAGSDLAFLPKSFIRGKGALETILSVSPSHLVHRVCDN